MEYLETTMNTFVFDFWFAGNGLPPTTNKYCDFKSKLRCSAMDEKWNFQCPKLNIYKMIFRNVSFFNTSPKISHNFQDIHHYIINLWKFCVN